MEWLRQYLTHENALLLLSVTWSVYVVIVAVWILLQRSAPVATLSWLLSMAAIPVGGLAIYYFFGPQRLKRQRIKRLRARKTSRVRSGVQRLRERMPGSPERLHQVARLVAATSDFPVSTATDLRLLVGGAATFDAIIDAVNAARHHIHLEYYIFEPDQTGTALRDLLIQRARAGIQVRLLVDALGSKSWGGAFCSRWRMRAPRSRCSMAPRSAGGCARSSTSAPTARSWCATARWASRAAST